MSGGAHPHGDCRECAAALREVGELRARESSLDDLLTGLGFTEGSLYQRIADLDWERKELRARMEDARLVARSALLLGGWDRAFVDAAGRILSHPAPAQATCETCKGRGWMPHPEASATCCPYHGSTGGLEYPCGDWTVAQLRHAEDGAIWDEGDDMPTVTPCPACSVRP